MSPPAPSPRRYGELEFLSGAKDEGFLARFRSISDTQRKSLQSRLAEPSLWRARHVQMVERQIGTKSGTGGATGAPYLRQRVPLRYYPLLWELRDHL